MNAACHICRDFSAATIHQLSAVKRALMLAKKTIPLLHGAKATLANMVSEVERNMEFLPKKSSLQNADVVEQTVEQENGQPSNVSMADSANLADGDAIQPSKIQQNPVEPLDEDVMKLAASTAKKLAQSVCLFLRSFLC